MTKRLYKFEFDFGRGYDGNGIFWEEPKNIKRLIGKTIYFGEICGKHSEVEVTIREDMLVDITDKIQDDTFCLGLQPQSYIPEFDYILTDCGKTLYPDDVFEPEEIKFGVNYYDTFYDKEDNFYKVYRKDITTSGSIVFYARKSTD